MKIHILFIVIIMRTPHYNHATAHHVSIMTRPQGGMMFGAMSSSNTTLLNHTILTVQGEAQVRPGSPPNPYLHSKEEAQAQAIPGSPLLNNTHLCTASEAHLHDIHYVQNVFKTIPVVRNAHNVCHKYSTKGLTCEKSYRNNRDYMLYSG